MADSEITEQDAEGDQIISMVDVLNDEQQLQDDANAVLGPCDDNICTYSQVKHMQCLRLSFCLRFQQLFALLISSLLTC